GPTGTSGPTGPTGPTGPSVALYNANSTDVTANATDTYITGSDLATPSNLKIGTILKWTLIATKTNTGTAVPSWAVRVGTGATVTDTARVTVTGAAQTAATDVGRFEVVAVVRATGATTIIAVGLEMQHNNGASGFQTVAVERQATSTGFDATIASTKIGLSVNPGTAAVWTFQVVAAELINRA